MNLAPGTVSVITKSGTSTSKAKSRRASGGGGGGPAGSGRGTGVSASRVNPSAPMASVGLMEMDVAESVGVLSPEAKQRVELQSRLHPSVLAVVDRLKRKNTNSGAAEATFIREGKAEIQIWLTDKSAENLAKLKELGFEVVLDPKSAKLIIGRIAIEKLEALAGLQFIRYVAPQVSGR